MRKSLKLKCIKRKKLKNIFSWNVINYLINYLGKQRKGSNLIKNKVEI